jgi:outer membrane lipoprotein LolB
LKKSFTVSILIFVLSGCQTVNQNKIKNEANANIVDQTQHFEALSSLNTWKIAGKLGVITPDKRNSVYINWQQNDLETDIKMTNILGVQLARVLDNKNGATLESEDQVLTDASPEGLIYQLTGWYLPVSQLNVWIKGLPNKNDNFETNQTGLVKSIDASCVGCGAWRISYSNYKLVDGISLPHKVRLSNDEQQTRLNLTISRWTL